MRTRIMCVLQGIKQMQLQVFRHVIQDILSKSFFWD